MSLQRILITIGARSYYVRPQIAIVTCDLLNLLQEIDTYLDANLELEEAVDIALLDDDSVELWAAMANLIEAVRAKKQRIRVP